MLAAVGTPTVAPSRKRKLSRSAFAGMRLLPAAFHLMLAMSWSTFGQTYTIYTAAGNETEGGGPFFGGDNGPATSALLYSPYGIAVDNDGNLYIADSGNCRIRKVSKGVITTVAGNGKPELGTSFSGDGGPATSAPLSGPVGVAVDSAGNIYIADVNKFRIFEVSNGVITTVAGSGGHGQFDAGGFGGDGGPATSAWLNEPSGVAVDSAGNIYIADSGNNRIREVSIGVITTVAGGGSSLGDGGPATSAQLNGPSGIAVDAAGNLYIADTYNNRIRKVANGVITTVAGDGAQGLGGDGGPAISAQVFRPQGAAVDSSGSLYIADTINNRIRKVANGVVTTVAGDGAYTIYGFSGDGGPATSAQLDAPMGVAPDSAGNVYIADTNNDRIRIMTPVGSSCAYSASPTALRAPAAGGNFTVGVQTSASCFWTVSGLPSWITVSGAFSASGSAAVTFEVPAGFGTARSATIFVAGISITVTQLAPLPHITALLNAASYASGAVSPGEIVSIFGTSIGPANPAFLALDSTGKVSNSIGGVTVSFSGYLAPLTYVSSTQINAIVPYEIAGNPLAFVEVTFAGQTSNEPSLQFAATAPGIFTQNSSGTGPGAILNGDSSLNSQQNPATPGSTVQIFMTGEGLTTPAQATGAVTPVNTSGVGPITPAPQLAVAVLIGNQPAQVIWDGEAPGLVAGVLQVDAAVPTTASAGANSITVQVGNQISQNGVTVWVK